MNTDEYRHLTFLFCDLVGSTPLSQELDHEDWRFVLGQFRKCCLDQVHNHGGIVHECQGDGFLFYFGFPVAYEDAALRAVRAALAIVRDCQQNLRESHEILQEHGQPCLSARIGIHSGKIVIGLIDGEDTATGFPLAFTVRLHSLAEPNTVVISEETRHLVAGEFRIADKGYACLKGIEYPVAYHEVTSFENSESSNAHSLQFVGRKLELAQLQAEWKLSIAGAGRAVLVSGDAGIGKSALFREFMSQVARNEFLSLKWRCLSNTQSIPLSPIIHGLTNMVSTAIDDTSRQSDVKRMDPADAEIWLRVLTDPKQSLVPAQLFQSKYDNEAYTVSSAEERKRFVLDGLVDWLIVQSHRHPLLMVLEDAHWIDHSTQEFFSALIKRLEESSILLLISSRYDAADIWGKSNPVSRMSLDRFSGDTAKELIVSIPGSNLLSEYEINRLVQRSDGVPLFIEESTAMMIDNQDELIDTESPVTALSAVNDKVPLRLMDLLTARLDHTGEARRTAGLAASIGREFSQDLLSAVSELDAAVVSSHLDTLLKKGLLQWGNEKHKLYVFKHELVRDAAYSTLLKSTRRLYHGKIAQALDSGKYTSVSVQPEILAYHFGEAQMKNRALDCWLLAAKKARFNSNPVEAISHYSQVKALLKKLPLDSHYLSGEKELEMLTGLGACYITVNGYGSDEAKECFESAEPIALRLGKMDKVMRIRFGLESYHFMRGDFSKALEISKNCFNIARIELAAAVQEQSANRVVKAQLSLSQSSWALGNVYFHKGEFARSLPLLQQCVELCHSPEIAGAQLVHSPDIMSQLYKVWYECETGALDSAMMNVEAIVESAREGGHAYTLCVALAFSACIYFFRGEFKTANSKADESIQLSEAPQFIIWLAWAKVLKGRCLCEENATRKQGLSEIEQGIELWDNSGSTVTRPFALTLLAESLLLNDDLASARNTIELAIETMHRCGERYYEAEIYRIKGNVHQRYDQVECAEQCYQRSIDFAHKRGMFRSVMRSAIDHVRLQSQSDGVPKSMKVLVHAREKNVGNSGLNDLMVADELIGKMSANRHLASA